MIRVDRLKNNPTSISEYRDVPNCKIEIPRLYTRCKTIKYLTDVFIFRQSRLCDCDSFPEEIHVVVGVVHFYPEFILAAIEHGDKGGSDDKNKRK